MSHPPLPSSQRPLPLVARNDLESQPIQYQDEQYWVVKDPLKLEYYRLQPQQYAVFELLDGQRSAEEVRAEFVRRFPTLRPTLAQIHHLIFDLYEKGLIWSTRPGQDEALARRAQRRRRRQWLDTLRNVLFIRLPGCDPEWFIRRVYPSMRWIFHPAVVLLAVVLVVLAWGMTAAQFDEFQRRLPNLYDFLSWQTVLVVWITLGAAKVLHELAHALACRHFGGECHEIGLALLVFSPCLYCDVSDSWLLPSKWKRMAVAAAGMYVELAISAVAMLLWWNTQKGLLNQALLSVILVTNVSVVLFNLNPLLRLDGYYLLSDWLEIPNLRRKSEQILARTFARLCLGVRAAPDPFLPQIGRFWFALYAALSACYRWALVLVISFVLYKTFQPYRLENLGLLVGGGTAALAVATGLRRFGKFVQLHGDQMRKSRRPLITLSLTVVLLAAALFVPLPLQIEAPLVVEPHSLRHVYATVPGQVAAVHVEPGATVRKGQLLVELTDWQRLERYRRLATARDVQQVEARIHQAIGDATQQALAAENLRAINEEVAALEEELGRLQIVAPCDGKIIAAPAVSAPPAGSQRRALPHWHGTPLDPQNMGCFVASGTHVLSIAPDNQFQAVLLIDQFDRYDFGAVREARLKIDHLPDRTLRGPVAGVATAVFDLSESGPPLGHSPDLRSAAKSGLAPQTTTAYRATVALKDNAPLLLPGTRGRARILVAERSAAVWLWRYVRNTFHFDL